MIDPSRWRLLLNGVVALAPITNVGSVYSACSFRTNYKGSARVIAGVGRCLHVIGAIRYLPLEFRHFRLRQSVRRLVMKTRVECRSHILLNYYAGYGHAERSPTSSGYAIPQFVTIH